MTALETAALAALALVLGLLAAIALRGEWRWQLVPVAAATVLALVLGSLLVLMPVRFLPAPTGPYALGTTTFTVTDDRPEIFTPDPDDRRTLPAQAWYPAEPTAGRREPYVRDPGVFRGILGYVGAPRFVLDHLGVAPTHAVPDAPAAAGRFPVVVFASGNFGYRQSNTVQVEELVSHGYVVVSFDQPGSAGSALLPDGRRVEHPGPAILKPLVDQSLEPVTPAPELAGTPYPDGLTAYFAADARAVLDHLADLDREGPLAGRLDLARVGTFGMSLGGIVVAQWCATDPRLRSCLVMDAPIPVDALARGLDAPTLFLTRPRADMAAEGWPDVEVRRYDDGQRALYAATRAPAWYVEVAGIRHVDLTDAPYGSPLLAWSGLVSARGGAHVHEVMRATTLAFFDRTLKADAAPGVLEHPPWPDVTIGSHP